MQDSLDHFIASEGKEHRFCYIEWQHGPGSIASIYYLDVPAVLGTSPARRFPVKDGFHDYIDRMKHEGWHEYQRYGDQEVYISWLIRSQDLDDQYMYCLLSCTFYANGILPTKLEGLYRIGNNNDPIQFGEVLSRNYQTAIQHLQTEHWEFLNSEDYQKFKDNSNVFIQLRFYRQPLP